MAEHEKRIRAGQIVTLRQGAWSDTSWTSPMRALKDFTVGEAAEAFLRDRVASPNFDRIAREPAAARGELPFLMISIGPLTDWLVREGYLGNIDDAEEIDLGDYELAVLGREQATALQNELAIRIDGHDDELESHE